VDDLPSLDENLYKGLLFIKNYQGNTEELSLTFAIDDERKYLLVFNLIILMINTNFILSFITKIYQLF